MKLENLVIKKRGRKPGQKNNMSKKVEYTPKLINFNKVQKLNKLDIDPRMMETMVSGINPMDKLISYEGGLPCASNLMFGGDPGVGKTTILLDYASALQNKNRDVLFVSAEMGRKNMFKYTTRFPQFGNVKTLFGSDFLDENMKDVMEQIFDLGFDCILIDSIAEVLAAVRDDMDWDKKQAEKWFVSLCVKNNNGENAKNKFTSFIAIQQLNASNGEFVGGNKIKYLFDSAFKILRDKKNTESTYVIAEKNRNGLSNSPLYYTLGTSSIEYSAFDGTVENLDEEKEESEK